MSGAFDDVTLTWKGRDYTIPARNMMGAIARIEDHVTMPEMQRFGERGTAPISRLSSAFAAVLRYAGAAVKDEDVYAAMFEAPEEAEVVATSIRTLLAMMVPRNAREKVLATKTESELEADAGNSLPAGAPTSRKRSSSRSVKGGSRRRSSGN